MELLINVVFVLITLAFAVYIFCIVRDDFRRCPGCGHTTLRKTGVIRKSALGLKHKLLREYICISCKRTEWRVRWFRRCPECVQAGAFGKTGVVRKEKFWSKHKILREYKCVSCGYIEWRVRGFEKCPICGRKGVLGKTGGTKFSRTYEQWGCIHCDHTEWREVPLE